MRYSGKELREIVGVRRYEKCVRWATDTKPCEGRQRFMT